MGVQRVLPWIGGSRKPLRWEEISQRPETGGFEPCSYPGWKPARPQSMQTALSSIHQDLTLRSLICSSSRSTNAPSASNISAPLDPTHPFLPLIRTCVIASSPDILTPSTKPLTHRTPPSGHLDSGQLFRSLPRDHFPWTCSWVPARLPARSWVLAHN